MVRQDNWHNITMIKNVRGKITILLWVVLACIVALNYGHIINIIKAIIKN